MSARLYRIFQTILLIALSFFLVGKIISGRLTLYINLRFLPLTVVGIALLLFMTLAVIAGMRNTQANGEHVHVLPGGLLLLWIPVLVGVFLPARPLDAAAVHSKGITVNAPLVSADTAGQQFEDAPDQRNVLDWIQIFAYEKNLSPYLGQQAKVIGFVYYADYLPENQFLVSRFVITCCAADGFALGIPFEWEGEPLNDNTWVIVEGPIDVTEINGQKIPLIMAESVELTSEPQQPYLFP